MLLQTEKDLGLSPDAVEWLGVLALALGLTFLVVWLWSRRRSRPAAVKQQKAWILVDGSNVMHWQDNTPQLAPVLRVLESLTALGYAPGVIFDANAGWKLMGRYLHDGDFARLLALPREQVLVVPKGTQADPYLLETARDFGARIVTNDRFRDWTEAHPMVQEQGFLIRGGMRDGKVWLTGVEAATAAAEPGPS